MSALVTLAVSLLLVAPAAGAVGPAVGGAVGPAVAAPASVWAAVPPSVSVAVLPSVSVAVLPSVSAAVPPSVSAAVPPSVSVAALASVSVGALPGWDWPLAGTPAVVRPFDPPAAPWAPGHRGVDLAAVPGDPVLAAGAGVVAFAGMVAGRGVVSVDHPGGLRTTYEPVAATVHIGDPVAVGTPLGTLDAGHPGCAAPACLHWGLRRGTTYLNPLLLLRPLRVRLKPLALH